jgi:hypothetical protein
MYPNLTFTSLHIYPVTEQQIQFSANFLFYRTHKQTKHWPIYVFQAIVALAFRRCRWNVCWFTGYSNWCSSWFYSVCLGECWDCSFQYVVTVSFQTVWSCSQLSPHYLTAEASINVIYHYLSSRSLFQVAQWNLPSHKFAWLPYCYYCYYLVADD